MRLSNGFVIDKEKTFEELKFTAVRDVFLQNEDGTPSTQLKKRIYDLKCSLHGGIIPVSVPPEVPRTASPAGAAGSSAAGRAPPAQPAGPSTGARPAPPGACRSTADTPPRRREAATAPAPPDFLPIRPSKSSPGSAADPHRAWPRRTGCSARPGACCQEASPRPAA